MQVRSAIRKRCAGCQFIRRRGYWYIICRNKPKHKQKQA